MDPSPVLTLNDPPIVPVGAIPKPIWKLEECKCNPHIKEVSKTTIIKNIAFQLFNNPGIQLCVCQNFDLSYYTHGSETTNLREAVCDYIRVLNRQHIIDNTSDHNSHLLYDIWNKGSIATILQLRNRSIVTVVQHIHYEHALTIAGGDKRHVQIKYDHQFNCQCNRLALIQAIKNEIYATGCVGTIYDIITIITDYSIISQDDESWKLQDDDKSNDRSEKQRGAMTIAEWNTFQRSQYYTNPLIRVFGSNERRVYINKYDDDAPMTNPPDEWPDYQPPSPPLPYSSDFDDDDEPPPPLIEL